LAGLFNDDDSPVLHKHDQTDDSTAITATPPATAPPSRSVLKNAAQKRYTRPAASVPVEEPQPHASRRMSGLNEASSFEEVQNNIAEATASRNAPPFPEVTDQTTILELYSYWHYGYIL
jgi:hypothetical protein